MVTHRALLLLSGPKQGCGPAQPPPVSSMLASQTSPPGGAEKDTNAQECHNMSTAHVLGTLPSLQPPDHG